MGGNGERDPQSAGAADLGPLLPPPERYSAYAFFGTVGPYLARLCTLRVGAFLGGMTEVMAAPIAAAIGRQGVRCGRTLR